MAEHADRLTVDGLRWGVEPIYRVLSEHGTPIAQAPSTTPAAAHIGRGERDEQLKIAIARVHQANYGVYGARKCGWRSTGRAPESRGAPSSG